MAAERNLDIVKEKLWEAFEQATNNRKNAATSGWAAHNENMNAIAELGRAIVAVESEQRIQAESAASGPALLKKPASGG